ncbi:small ubiquitin-related modifier 2-like [Vicia villosa]|uniref:small ubiquitin-related modifier 2-like n=1 Tax=Vicia villosa TaxID=3911 RepID=UPI00273B1B90|nr:small ubiquitin-related modifier 2-like [Vicia villosa]
MNQGTRIELKVNGQDGNAVFVFIDRSSRLKKLMDAYCDHFSMDINSTAFMFNEHRIQEELSPDEMQMEDGDEIDAIFCDQSGYIVLKVKGQVGFETLFKMKRSRPLEKLMDAYCCRYCFDFHEIAFLFNGRLVEWDQTPYELGMKDGDEMLAMLQLRRV